MSGLSFPSIYKSSLEIFFPISHFLFFKNLSKIFLCLESKGEEEVQGWFVLINFYFYWLSSWGDKLLKGHQKVVRNNLKNVTLVWKEK